MKGYESVAEEIVRQGVNAVFGLMSEETAKLTLALERRGISYYGARHEALAVGMADGYSRATGGLGVAVIGRGPGFTNGLTSMITASKARSRVVILIGDGHPEIDLPANVLHAKFVDQAAILAGADIETAHLTPGSAAAQTAAVFDRARTGSTVAFNLPDPVLHSDVTHTEAPTPAPAATPAPPDPAEIALVADLLAESWAVRHPVIIVGRGALRAGVKEDLERIGAACGALLGSTLQARELFRGDPFDLGVIGTYSSEATIELVREADLVLAFGASLNGFTTVDGAMFPKARVIQFDRDKRAFGRYAPIEPDLGVTGDAPLAIRALADEIEHRGLSSQGYRSEAVAERLAASRRRREVTDRGRPGAVDPRLLMRRLDEILPRDRLVVVDGGHYSAFALENLAVTGPENSLYPIEYWCVGAGVGVALGAAVARAPQTVVLCTGDGALMMTLADLHTAVRYSLPLVVIVNNDFAFGSEVHFLHGSGMDADLARHPNPPFEFVAKAIGADGLTVETIEDLEQLPGRLEALTRPLLIDCKITTEVRSEQLEHYYAQKRENEQAAARLSDPANV